jgi:hypothetical protein
MARQGIEIFCDPLATEYSVVDIAHCASFLSVWLTHPAPDVTEQINGRAEGTQRN